MSQIFYLTNKASFTEKNALIMFYFCSYLKLRLTWWCSVNRFFQITNKHFRSDYISELRSQIAVSLMAKKFTLPYFWSFQSLMEICIAVEIYISHRASSAPSVLKCIRDLWSAITLARNTIFWRARKEFKFEYQYSDLCLL